MASEVAFDEALRAFSNLSDKGNVDFDPSAMNSAGIFHPRADGLPMQASELGEVSTPHTSHVPAKPQQDDSTVLHCIDPRNARIGEERDQKVGMGAPIELAPPPPSSRRPLKYNHI